MKILLKTILLIGVAALTASRLSAALPGADALVKLIMKEYDTNSDESIDSGEWQDGIGRSFAKLDRNGDGFLQPDEADILTGVIAEDAGELAAGITVALVKQILLAMDTNGDKLLSRGEYLASVTEVFAKVDADRNNNISRDEAADLPVKLLAK